MQQPLIRAGGCHVWAVLWWAAFTLAVLLVGFFGPWRWQFISAGPVSSNHHGIAFANLRHSRPASDGCAACHVAGVAGAPKAGDKVAWAPRLKTGNEALYTSALKGKGATPAKGGMPVAG